MAGPLTEVRPIRIRRVGRIFLCPLPDSSMPGCPTPLCRVARPLYAELPDSPRRVAQLVESSCPTRKYGFGQAFYYPITGK